MFFLMLPLVIGLPITNQSLPFLYACLGVETLFWSFNFELNLIPGVIISFLNTFLTIFTSWGLHTIASNFALFANFAWWRTSFFTFLLKPISLRVLLSKEVKIVTPIYLILPETFLEAFKAFKPELIWIVK